MNLFDAFLIILISSSNTATITNLAYYDDLNQSNSQKCLSLVVNRYFTDQTTVFVDSNFNFEHAKISFDFASFYTLNSIKVKLNNYVIAYNDLSQLNKTLFELKARRLSWNSRGKYLIIMRNLIDIEEIDETLRLLWKLNVYNSVIAVVDQRSDHYLSLYTYDFIRSKCGKAIKAERVSVCQNGVMIIQSELYERKIKHDLCNNSFAVLWGFADPFARDYKLQKNPGILISAIKLFAETSNLSLTFSEDGLRYLEETQNIADHPIVLEDFNKNYGEIFVSLNGYDYAKCCKLYDCSVSTHHEIIYWILPKPIKKPFWKSITIPFTVETWTVICVTLSFITLTFWCISHHPQENPSFQSCIRCAIFTLRVKLGDGDNLFPKTLSFRVCFLFFSLGSLLMDTYYQGKLFSFLSDPSYEKGITTLDDILNSGLPLIFQEGVGLLFLMMGPKSQQVFDTFIASNGTIEEDLYFAVKDKDFLTITSGGQITINPHLRNSFNTLEVYFFHINFYMKRDHVLLDRLNVVLQRITESGFYHKWISDIELEYFKQPTVNNAEGVFRLTINHLEGAFAILSIGCCLAFITFLSELISRAIFRFKAVACCIDHINRKM